MLLSLFVGPCRQNESAKNDLKLCPTKIWKKYHHQENCFQRIMSELSRNWMKTWKVTITATIKSPSFRWYEIFYTSFLTVKHDVTGTASRAPLRVHVS